MKYKALMALFLISSQIGCSTLTESTLLGAGIGASSGALLGNAIGTQNGNTTNGTWIGAASGLVFGGLIGYFGGKDKQSKIPRPTESKAPESKVPSLSAPEVRRIWVPSKIENSKFIEGHYEFIIERQSVWIDQ